MERKKQEKVAPRAAEFAPDPQVPHRQHVSHARAPGSEGPGQRSDDADAFFPDPGEGVARVPDDLAQELAEEFLETATSGEYVAEDGLDEAVPEDNGGPLTIVKRP